MSDGAHDQRLARVQIARGEKAGGDLMRTRQNSRHAALREGEGKVLCGLRLAADEARCDQQKLAGEHALRALYRNHASVRAARHAHDLHRADAPGFVREDARNGGFELTRIAALQRDGFQLAVIGAQRARPLRPGIVLRARDGRCGHQLQLCDGAAALPQTGRHAVVAGIAAAYDNDVLLPGACFTRAAVQQRARRLAQIIDRE